MFFKQKAQKTQHKEQKRENKPNQATNEMVECAHCALYVEISEAILSNGKYYCSNECLKEARE
jgi:uncharacterized protein